MADTPRSIWLRKERSGRGPTPEHGRAQIAAAAIELADAGGLEAVSTRKVAAAIGAGATSLYRYVENRNELLDLMLDTACGELDLSGSVGIDWRRELGDLAQQLRAMYSRHPWLLDLTLGPTPLTPSSVAFLEYALATLANVDVPAGLKMEAIAMLNGLVAMVCRLEVTTGTSTQAWQDAQVEFLTAVVAAGYHPHLAAAVQSPPSPSPSSNDGTDLIDRVLPRVLSGILETP